MSRQTQYLHLQLHGGYNRERSKEFVKLSKRNLRSLTGFLSGQLRVHLKRIGLEKRGDCRFCGDEKETPQHLLCKCDVVSNIKTNLFGSSIINDEEISSLKPAQLLVGISETRTRPLDLLCWRRQPSTSK